MHTIFDSDVYLNKKLLEEHGFNYLENFQKIREHNKKFIERNLKLNQEYFDNMFNNIDKNIKLDEEQRQAILKDEDYNLIIAGAGSGKTTTMMAKIKYLVDKKNINPNEILAISFAKKNTTELKEK